LQQKAGKRIADTNQAFRFKKPLVKFIYSNNQFQINPFCQFSMLKLGNSSTKIH